MTSEQLNFEIEAARMRREVIQCEIELNGSNPALDKFLMDSAEELTQLLKLKPE
jgi:hypothetical protein